MSGRPNTVLRGLAVTSPLVLLLAACGGDSGTTPGGTDTMPAAVSVSPASPALAAIGDTVVLSAAVTNASGQAVSATVEWTSASPEVAMAVGQGRVVATGNGTARITATAGGISGSATVTVRQAVTGTETSGNEQAGDAGSLLDSTVVVTLLDARGNGVAGAPISFSVRTGGGSIDPGEGVTDASGSASFEWTLGTGAGIQEVDVVGGFDGEGSALVSATALPLAPDELLLFGGDGQTEIVRAPVPAPLQLQVLDSLGNGVPDVEVRLTVSGDAVIDTLVFTDLDGVASAALTLGTALGPYDVSATSFVLVDTMGTTVELTGSPVALAAEAVDFTVGAAPALTVGETVTISGTGFHPVPDSNRVVLGDLTMAVVDGTQSSLTLEVPDFGCTPEQLRPLAVSRTGAAHQQSVLVSPVGVLSLAVGERFILSDSEDFCIQLPAGSNTEYLVGLTATEPFDASTSFSLVGVDSAAAAAPAPAPAYAAPQETSGLRVHSDEGLAAGVASWGSPELLLRARESALVESGRPLLTEAPPARAVDIGQALSWRMPNFTTDPCNDYIPISLEVVYAGGRLAVAIPSDLVVGVGGPIWLAFITAIESLFQTFGTTGIDILATHLGAPGSWDGSEQIVLALTREVSDLGVGAFASVVDRLPRSLCPSSDEERIVYVDLPAVVDLLSLPGVLDDVPADLAHHITHIVQWDRRIGAGGDLLPGWIAEGQAEAVVERVGLGLAGQWNTQNRDVSILVTNPGLAFWIPEIFDRLSLFQGEDPNVNLAVLAGAPEGCSLFAFQGVCGRGAIPGAAWSFLRYVGDVYGPAIPGGTDALMSALIDLDSAEDEIAQLEVILGASFGDVMVDWAATLYADDRLGPSVSGLQLPSWNLVSWLSAAQGRVRHAPPFFGFVGFERMGSVIGGGTAYTRVTTGAAHRPLSLTLDNGAGGAVAELLAPRFWVARLR